MARWRDQRLERRVAREMGTCKANPAGHSALWENSPVAINPSPPPQGPPQRGPPVAQ